MRIFYINFKFQERDALKNYLNRVEDNYKSSKVLYLQKLLLHFFQVYIQVSKIF